MPYVSNAQRGYFNANRKKLEAEGVDVEEWNHASKGLHLPAHKGDAMKHEKEDGLDGLTKPREKKHEEEPKGEKKKPTSHHPKGATLREIHTRQLHDGTFHHTHHYEDAKGLPHPMQHEASSATADDAGNYVAEQFGGGGADEGEQEPAAAQEPNPAAPPLQ